MRHELWNLMMDACLHAHFTLCFMSHTMEPRLKTMHTQSIDTKRPLGEIFPLNSMIGPC